MTDYGIDALLKKNTAAETADPPTNSAPRMRPPQRRNDVLLEPVVVDLEPLGGTQHELARFEQLDLGLIRLIQMEKRQRSSRKQITDIHRTADDLLAVSMQTSTMLQEHQKQSDDQFKVLAVIAGVGLLIGIGSLIIGYRIIKHSAELLLTAKRTTSLIRKHDKRLRAGLEMLSGQHN